MYYRTMPSLRLDEELVEDGQGGQQIVPAYLRKLITWQRKDCEEASCRILTNEAIKFIPAGFSNWARMQLEMCIRAHDMRNNCANQRTYRLGINHKMRAGERPNFLSVHALRCIYFKHMPAVKRRLEKDGWGWMLKTKFTWDASGERIKDPNGAWFTVDPPSMPVHTRKHLLTKHEREQPLYIVHPSGDITVHQSWIPGHSPATLEEMLACDDRIEKDIYGNIRYIGPPRPKKAGRDVRHLMGAAEQFFLPAPTNNISWPQRAAYIVKHIVMAVFFAILVWHLLAPARGDRRHGD